MAARKLALAAAVPWCWRPARRAGRAAPDADAARDAALVVDPVELVALAGGAGTADRLVAPRGGARLPRRAPRPAAGPRARAPHPAAPGGRRPGRGDRARSRAREPAATVGRNHAYRGGPAPARRAEPRAYADALLGWPAAGCPARQPVGVIDTALDPAAPALAGARDHHAATSARGGASADTRARHRGRRADRRAGAAVRRAALPRRRGRRGAGRRPGRRRRRHRPRGRLARRRGRAARQRQPGRPLQQDPRPRPRRRRRARHASWSPPPATTATAAPPRYPAAFDYAIAVTAVDAALEPYDRAPRGEHIDVAAPGVDVFVPAGGYMTGTSIAAPFVTAAIAADPAAVGLGPARRAPPPARGGARPRPGGARRHLRRRPRHARRPRCPGARPVSG